MQLIHPSFEIITPNQHIAGMGKRIEAAGRVCYKSEEKIKEGSDSKFIRMILARGHETVIEHESISVRIICDRGVSHELVRHRIASFSQESTRYCDYSEETRDTPSGNGVQFIIPSWGPNIKPGTFPGFSYDENVSEAELLWLQAMANISICYGLLRERGCSPQEARSVLPNSLKTEIVMTANLREWRHFFNLRCAKAAHPQMREITLPMLVQFYNHLPAIFGDLYEKFYENQLD